MEVKGKNIGMKSLKQDHSPIVRDSGGRWSLLSFWGCPTTNRRAQATLVGRATATTISQIPSLACLSFCTDQDRFPTPTGTHSYPPSICTSVPASHVLSSFLFFFSSLFMSSSSLLVVTYSQIHVRCQFCDLKIELP